MNKVSGVYMISNIINNKCYIGSSIDTDKRISWHLSLLRNDKHYIEELQNDWNEYGEENFVFEIVAEINDIEQRVNTEQLYIDCFKPEYNKCLKAFIPYQMDEEKRKESYENRSKAQSGENNPRCKIRESDIAKIKKLVEEGELNYSQIGQKFGITGSQVGNIVSGLRWKNIAG